MRRAKEMDGGTIPHLEFLLEKFTTDSTRIRVSGEDKIVFQEVLKKEIERRREILDKVKDFKKLGLTDEILKLLQ